MHSRAMEGEVDVKCSFFFFFNFFKGMLPPFIHICRYGGTFFFFFFFTRTINLWNWILYHLDNIAINARQTNRARETYREWEMQDAGIGSIKSSGSKEEVKWQGQGQPATVIHSLLAHRDRGAKQPTQKLWMKKPSWNHRLRGKLENDACAGWRGRGTFHPVPWRHIQL